jgi:AbrB family looped-hinge helix DNA binding protein
MDVKRTYTIQENGQITLPIEWREKYGLKKGDLVSFVETDDGSLKVIPRVALAMDALDRIGAALKEKGISFEEMLATLEETRQELFDEKYAAQLKRNG